MVFARLAVEKAAKMRAGGAQFHDWFPPEDGKVVVRLATVLRHARRRRGEADRTGEEE